MGIEALLPALKLSQALKRAGITRGRLDIDAAKQSALLSIAQQGTIRQIWVPIGITITAEEIAELLTRPGSSLSAPAPDQRPDTPIVGTSPP